MGEKLKKVLEILISVALVVCILVGTNWVANKAHSSTILTQSRILRDLLSQDDSVNFLSIISEESKRQAAEKFTAALTNAYISFELIPYDEGKTFAAIMASLEEGVEIDSFEYHGGDITIVGGTGSYEEYQLFIKNLEDSETFDSILQNDIDIHGDGVSFDITCVAVARATAPDLFSPN